MKTQYKRLTQYERFQIEILLKSGKSITSIAQELNRNYSTIYREVNRLKKGKYCAKKALSIAVSKSVSRKYNKTKIFTNPLLKKFIYDKLNQRWSPEQISLTLKKLFPNDHSMNISFESIYFHIYIHSGPELRKILISKLRQSRIVRGNTRRGVDKRATIKDRTMIDERPDEVLGREIPGHWEGDLILGKNRESAIGTLVERTTRALIIVHLKNRDAESVRIAFEKELKALPKLMKKSLTYDNGTEMAQHKLFTNNTKIQVSFTHPYSPWERPTNENFNGLIRDYFPKGTDFEKVTRKQLKMVQDQLNNRPRKVLDMQTPNEVFNNYILNKI
ncbi:MAG: IS30 family transposase [Flavobacterium sp.]